MEFDEIGLWSVEKLEIVKKYAKAYSTILSKYLYFKHYYIDAFAGAGIHINKSSKDLIPGSPINALEIRPPFDHYYLVDVEQKKVDLLSELIGDRDNVDIINGDSNFILPEHIFPKIRRDEYKRALCFLDPYGLHLKWNVILKACEMETIEIFLNFPILDMNRNVLWLKPEHVNESQLERMNDFWGDTTWYEYAYDTSQTNMFGTFTPVKKKITYLVNAFKMRLKNVAGYKYVPDPIPMRGKKGGAYYYIFFASHNKTGAKIAREIFNKYRK